MVWPLVAATAASALIGSQAAKSAASSQLAGVQAGIGEQGRQYDQTRADLAPWREAGTWGVQTLAEMLGRDTPASPRPSRADYTETTPRPQFGFQTGGLFGGPETTFDQAGYDDAMAAWQSELGDQPAHQGVLVQPYEWEEDPAYEFIKSEGEKAVGRNASTAGLRRSGAYDKALSRFVQNNANTFWQMGFDRDQANKSLLFNMFSGVANPGAQVTTEGARIGQNNANNVSNLMTQAGNVNAAGTVGQANAITGAANNFAQMYYLNDFLKGPTSTAPSTTTAGFNANVPWLAGN